MTTSGRWRWTVGAAVALALALALAAIQAGADEGEDAELRAKVEQRLRRANFVEHHDVRVRVEDGRVMLEGSVQADHEKERAGELARAVDGVEAVDNRLLVAKGAGDPDALPPIDAGAPLPTLPTMP